MLSYVMQIIEVMKVLAIIKERLRHV